MSQVSGDCHTFKMVSLQALSWSGLGSQTMQMFTHQSEWLNSKTEQLVTIAVVSISINLWFLGPNRRCTCFNRVAAASASASTTTRTRQRNRNKNKNRKKNRYRNRCKKNQKNKNETRTRRLVYTQLRTRTRMRRLVNKNNNKKNHSRD